MAAPSGKRPASATRADSQPGVDRQFACVLGESAAGWRGQDRRRIARHFGISGYRIGVLYCRAVSLRPGPHDLRASDADRELVIDLLSQAAADGRLTLPEHAERSERALAARTLGELTGLTADLALPSGQPIRLYPRRSVTAAFDSHRVLRQGAARPAGRRAAKAADHDRCRGRRRGDPPDRSGGRCCRVGRPIVRWHQECAGQDQGGQPAGCWECRCRGPHIYPLRRGESGDRAAIALAVSRRAARAMAQP